MPGRVSNRSCKLLFGAHRRDLSQTWKLRHGGSQTVIRAVGGDGASQEGCQRRGWGASGPWRGPSACFCLGLGRRSPSAVPPHVLSDYFSCSFPQSRIGTHLAAACPQPGGPVPAGSSIQSVSQGGNVSEPRTRLHGLCLETSDPGLLSLLG